MARMGHDSERAAMIYQHEARGAYQPITNAIDSHVQAEQRGDDDDGQAGVLAPMGSRARRFNDCPAEGTGHARIPTLTCKGASGAGDENRTRTISLGS